jgi:predicted MPP superfamily phosphohydrolase
MGRVTSRTPSRRRRLLVPALLAAGVVALEVARVYLLQPLHLRGIAQGPISVLLDLSWVLMVPGDHLVDFVRQWQPVERTFAAVNTWRVFLLVSFLFYFAVFYVLASINRWINRRIEGKPVEPPAGEAPAPQPRRRISRRRVLRITKGTVTAGVGAAAAYPLLVEPHRLEVTRHTFAIDGLPASLDGLRIVQITDVHLGPWTSVGRVRRIVETANALHADLVALTGDYVLQSPAYIPQAAVALAGLRARIGLLGVLGNHDWGQDGPLSTRELTKAGVRMIDNGRLFLTPDRRLTAQPIDEGLCLAGVGDLWRDRQLYDRALGGVPGHLPRLLLSHNPDVAEEREFIASGFRVDLMLSGHTHGGQVVLPLVGAPVTMSRYGQKYARGLVQGPTCPVFVSRGLGMAMLPIRLGSVPEMPVLELRRATSGSNAE